jgi:hypothetical protein
VANKHLREKMIELGALPRPAAPELKKFPTRRLDSEQMVQEIKDTITGVKVLTSVYAQYLEIATLPLTLEVAAPAKATGLAFEELGSASLLDKGLELEFSGSRAARYVAEDLHYVLINEGERAVRSRATAVLRALNPETGEIVNVFSAYPRIAPIQRTLAERMGVLLAPVIEGAHAEGSALLFSKSARLLPMEGGVAGPHICPMCRLNIEDVQGGMLINSREFILPEVVGGK